jgi:hypothetical protein
MLYYSIPSATQTCPMDRIETRVAGVEFEPSFENVSEHPIVADTSRKNRPSVPSKYIYWCTSHQMLVAPGTRRELEDHRGCQIVRLDLNLLLRVDLHCLSTWISSEHSTRKQIN